MQTKTDNALINVKLMLRRYFIEKYHRGKKFNVMDCCQGSGELWKNLRKEYICNYVGYDVKPKKGRIKIDSRRMLDVPGLQYDIVDIDTYGEPWDHYFRLVKNTKLPVTVFMTHGLVAMGGGNLSNVASNAIGFGKISKICPRSLLVKAAKNNISYCIAVCYKYDIKIIEAIEAFPQRKARYYGLRLERNIS